MSPKNDLPSVLSSPEWLPSHWDNARGKVKFEWIARDRHGQLTFLGDEYLQPLSLPSVAKSLGELTSAGMPQPSAPHYIFHSAFCCSTLLARALDAAGASMALKEPQILNDLAAAMQARTLAREPLDIIIRLLARPFGPGERIVIKPSNSVNLLAPALMDLDAGSKAIFLYAPLDRFLGSIAAKGLWGRRWARHLYAALRADTGLDFGIPAGEEFELTDIQAAALAWLMHHAQAEALLQRFPQRLRTLDSETFLERKADVIEAAAMHFALPLDREAAERIAAGPVFREHSKEIGRAVDPQTRFDRANSAAIIGEEIAMVVTWTISVAQHVGLAVEFAPASGLVP
ncbi:MAG: hypothetical protein ACJ8FT_10420 [Sphingomonas sp.]